jgi:SAM-dependent methyltransferase
LNRHCPVCNQQQAKFLFLPSASPGPVSKCLNCGMVYIANIEDDHGLIFDGPVIYSHTKPDITTSSNLNDIKALWEYNALPGKEAEWPALRQNANDALQRIEFHSRRPAAERRILDFGSGWGFFLAVARERGWLPFGLEPLPACAVYARAKFALNVITDTLRDDTYPSDYFDAVASFQVFEHLPHPDQDIQILYRILRPDGIILIEVPNFDTWTMRLMKSRHRHFAQDHLNFFSRETLTQFLTSNHFKVVDSYFPKRRMSIRHLFNFWLPKYLPAFIVDILGRAFQNTVLWETTLGINLGDIVAIIARKIS